jgi:hypothetical protein
MRTAERMGFPRSNHADPPASSPDLSALSGVFEATRKSTTLFDTTKTPISRQRSFGRIRGKSILSRHGQTVIVPGQYLGRGARLIGRLDADSLAGKFDCQSCRTDASTSVGRP